ncbi:MAG: restriction endonuclease, partial [Enterobacter sp.]
LLLCHGMVCVVGRMRDLILQLSKSSIYSTKPFYGCDEAMVVTNSYFTRSAKELAESALVRLIDRDELQKYLDDYNQKIIEDFQSNS